jgi:hypothetical protein
MGQKPSKIGLIICLVLITYLPFLAITFLPLSLILVFLLWLQKLLKVNYLFYVLVFSILPNLIFLSGNGSWRGFFVQHIYINSTISPNYYPYQRFKDLPMNLLRSFEPNQFWILPLLLVGIIAIVWFKKSYFEICGLLAGASTDPPALTFALKIAGNDIPSATYATVYPLTMILRIVASQLLILFFS